MEIETNKIIPLISHFFNPLVDKSPVGANLVNEEINIKLTFPSNFNIWDVNLIILDDNEELVKEINLTNTFGKEYRCAFTIDAKGLYWYYFSFSDTFGRHFLTSSESLDAKLSDEVKDFYQLLIHDAFNSKVDWFQKGIMYQIMPDRFYKGANNPVKDYAYMHKNWEEEPFYKQTNGKWNIDFFGGDIQGIIAKLDYLKELNVTTIYLNPIFFANSNHKYDTANYLEIDPMFGTEADFVSLCKIAKEKGIHIVLDMVFNHSGDDSIYFNKYGHFENVGAFQSKSSKYRSWYSFGSDYKNGYRAWWDIESLPAFNQQSKEYLDFISQVLKKWLSLGASGVRLDVVDELNNDVVYAINKACKEVGLDKLIIGEVWEDASNKIAYEERKHYFDGHHLDSVMNYVFKKAIIKYINDNDGVSLRNTIRSVINNYPRCVLDCLMNILDTHDTCRLVNNFYDFTPNSKEEAANFKVSNEVKTLAIKKAKMASVMQFTLPGVPCLYYGDEAGLDGFDDPFCRKTYPWGNEDKEMFIWYQKLTKMRKDDIFNGGDYQEIKFATPIIKYKRIKNGKEIYVIINNVNVFYEENIKCTDMLENKKVDLIHVAPFSAGVYKL